MDKSEGKSPPAFGARRMCCITHDGLPIAGLIECPSHSTRWAFEPSVEIAGTHLPHLLAFILDEMDTSRARSCGPMCDTFL